MKNEKNGPVEVIGMLWIKDGVDPQKGYEYLTKHLAPFIKKHGGELLADIFPLKVHMAMKGDLQPNFIEGYRFTSKEAMQGLFQDPEYQKIVPIRDATFDMARHTMFVVSSGK